MSTRPCMSKVTPSLSSSDRWTPGPPNVSSGDSSPLTLTPRWPGSPDLTGAARIAQPTVRAAPGLPRARAMAPYVVTLPRGIFAAMLQTRSNRAPDSLMWLLPDRWRLSPLHEAATPAHPAAAHPGHWRLNMGRTNTAPPASSAHHRRAA